VLPSSSVDSKDQIKIKLPEPEHPRNSRRDVYRIGLRDAIKIILFQLLSLFLLGWAMMSTKIGKPLFTEEIKQWHAYRYV